MNPETRAKINLERIRPYRTGRDFLEYVKFFGYAKKEHLLAGKTILDVGAGDGGFLDQYGARVVRLDPDYSVAPPRIKKNAVAAIAQELPFADESFDEVVALYSLFWVKTGIENALSEMLRVTKTGGVVRIAPSYNDSKKDHSNGLRELSIFSVSKSKKTKPGTYPKRSLNIRKLQDTTDEEREQTIKKAVTLIRKARSVCFTDDFLKLKLEPVSWHDIYRK